MAKGQMRSNKEKKKPKADKNLQEGRRRAGQSVRGRQDPRRAEPEQEELGPGFRTLCRVRRGTRRCRPRWRGGARNAAAASRT